MTAEEIESLKKEIESLKKGLKELEDYAARDIARVRRRVFALSVATGAYTDYWETAEEVRDLLREEGFVYPTDNNRKLAYTIDVQVYGLLTEQKRLTTGQILKAFDTTRPTAITAMRRLCETYPNITMRKERLSKGTRRQWVVYFGAA